MAKKRPQIDTTIDPSTRPVYTPPQPNVSKRGNNMTLIANYIENDIVDQACTKMLADMVPVPDVYFAALGVPKVTYTSAMWRAKSQPWDQRDIYLLAAVEETIAKVEIECLRDWRAGSTGAERMLQVLVKRYNPGYMQALNTELQHMMKLVAFRCAEAGQEDVLEKILDDIIEFQPELQLADDGTMIHLPAPNPAKKLGKGNE